MLARRSLATILCLVLGACSDDGMTGGGGASSASTGGSTSTATSTSTSTSTATSVSTSSSASSTASTTSSTSSSSSGGSGGSPGCQQVTGSSALTIGTAPTAGEYALQLPAASDSSTSWRESGNEALILDVSTPEHPVGQLVLHQGHDGFTYSMSLGHLDAGEAVRVQVSSLSSASATKSACVGPAELNEAASLGNLGDALTHAPIFKWPTKKRFDDLPMLLGWSKKDKAYEAFYTNENGGTANLCGGGADGMQAEIARWGRGADVERMYNYTPASPTWERCTGSVGEDVTALHTEAAHPIVYYGDGHNRLFESRGGYGNGCGTDGDKQADGDIDGWNKNNPGNDPSLDAPYVITIRPFPVELDPLGYAAHTGRREGVIDTYAPWLYRVTDGELEREGKIDGTKVQPMQNYLFVDVHANDVGGSGDSYCSVMVKSGFKLRAAIKNGPTISGQQMTADYMGGEDAIKRYTFPLGAAYQPSDIASIVFDAYDDDGIYFLDLGDTFLVQPSGENGATIAYVNKGSRTINQYVDDDNSGCTNGTNSDGPSPPYPCAGGQYSVSLP